MHVDFVFNLSSPQFDVFTSKARFRVVVSGRRFGKTHLATTVLLCKAVEAKQQRCWYVAPSYRQAKQIAWLMLKRSLPASLIKRVNESDLTLELFNDSTISLRGADNFDSLRGVGLNFIVMDEFADIKPEAWFEVLRATLSDTGGAALFLGTPKGRNWAYDLYQRGLDPQEPHWAAFSYTTIEGGNVPPEEVEIARRELDELTFNQEYNASFVNFEGRVYYPFQIDSHVAHLRELYNPRAPLAFGFDFNVEPGVASVCQEVVLPNGVEGTAVIGEVYIPRNSNTPAVCRKLIADWGSHQGQIYCYGDATGGSRGSAKVAGSDWDLIKDAFRHSPFANRIAYRVPSCNPHERARVNAMNSRLKSDTGEVRLMVDARYAPHVIKDLEGVALLKGGSGEIDKKGSPDLTHMCFSPGTLVSTENGVFPIELMPEKGNVLTWNGEFVPYESCGMTMPHEQTVRAILSDKTEIYCTPEHAFLTNRGWVCAKNLTNTNLITPELLLYAAMSNKCLKGYVTSGTMVKKGISEGLQTLANSIYTELCGRTTMVKSLMECMFTTKMGIDQTIQLEILSLLKENITCQCTTKTYHKTLEKKESNGLESTTKKQKNGIQVKKEEYGTQSMLRVKKTKIRNVFASIAEKNFLPNNQMQSSVVKTVEQDIDIIQGLTMRVAIALIAESLLSQINIQNKNIVHDHALRVIEVKEGIKTPVYCLSVPNNRCFCLSNGAIVSNSDALGYYVCSEFPTTKKTVTAAHYSGMRL